MLCHLQKRTTILTAARPEPSALSGQRAVVAWVVEWVRHGCTGLQRTVTCYQD